MSSTAVQFEFLLKITPNEVLYDFLAQCGLPLQAGASTGENLLDEKLRIVVAIACAPSSIRDLVLARMRRILSASDEDGIAALCVASLMSTGNAVALPRHETPTAYALWMFMRRRDVFDAACRRRKADVRACETVALERLRRPLPLPDDLKIGSVHLQQVTLLDEITGGEFTVSAPAGEIGADALALLAMWLPSDNPMQREHFQVVAATLRVAFLPAVSGDTGRVEMLRLKRRGGCDLGGFDAQTQLQLIGWLNHWQLLSANDAHIPRASLLTA